MKSEILAKPGEVANALHGLDGLEHQTLHDAIVYGEMARDACTPNDPRSAAGFFAWSYSTRRLRETLIPRGWTPEDPDGLALVVSPSKKIAIAVSTGDAGTGDPSAVPRTKYPKGPATKLLVDANRQMELWPEKERDKDDDSAIRETWLLLRRRDRTKDCLFYEMSLPWDLDADLHVVKWSRRIVFQPMSFKPTVTPEPEGDPIDIQIKRRT